MTATETRNRMLAIVVDGEAFGYLPLDADAATIGAEVREAANTLKVPLEEVAVIDSATPCRTSTAWMSGSGICEECGDYCGCTVCRA